MYLGGQPIDHVAPALARAKQQGARSVFVTNNASRPPAGGGRVADRDGRAAEPDDVLTSPQAAAVMLTDRHPAGTKVLVIGAPWLAESVTQAGLVPVRLATDEPAAVVQGHSPDTGWRELAEACIALRAGADWVACNVDSTLPTDRGLLPGNGCDGGRAGRGNRTAAHGWPGSPRVRCSMPRSGWSDSQRPLVVGDRLDTDIACAVAAGSPSLLVFTGVSTAADLLAAVPEQRPTYLAFDLRGLVEEDHAVRIPAAVVVGQQPGMVGRRRAPARWSWPPDAGRVATDGGFRRQCTASAGHADRPGLGIGDHRRACPGSQRRQLALARCGLWSPRQPADRCRT